MLIVVIVRFSDACPSLFVRPCRRGFPQPASAAPDWSPSMMPVSEMIESRRQSSRGFGHVRLLGDGLVEVSPVSHLRPGA